jgi:hypothetical protein
MFLIYLSMIGSILVTHLVYITYPHVSLVGILVSRYMMVNYHYL